MTHTLNEKVSTERLEEIKEFISTLILLPVEDRAILLSNANALRARQEIEKSKEGYSNEKI